ncbi:hypothetical protein EJ04DRAFT_557967 [Polyplosphaeria fusca]|uniref:Azaphilone pigments biosynthesis cluster protein L N-terminal domain-containing protein n=1 Tax=Polyplosphaeria fusca TaxID=682080 RepID=A0A9P4RCZ3_9PLEO|nr:hypothetical protein EJ04DRAFT_557967 [Polyplosphaeria fusca]
MSFLGEASAIIGIASVTITGINTLYKYVKELKDVPRAVETLQEELALLESNLRGLESLKTADPKIQDEINQTGLFQALEKCDKDCKQLKEDFDTWARRGEGSWLRKLDARRHLRRITKVEGTVDEVRNTQRALVCAVSILNLRLFLSQSISLSDNEANVQQVVLWRSEVESARNSALERAQIIEQENDDDVDAEVAVSELKKQADTSGDFLALYDKIISRLQNAEQLKQKIGNTTTAKTGKAQVGMPKDIVPLVQSQTIGDTDTGEGAESVVGIF